MKEKKCPKCKKTKSLNSFSKNNRRNDKLQIYCKFCFKEIATNYKHSKLGLIAQLYTSQKTSSKIRDINPPIYTKHELTKWILNQDLFHNLYDNWCKSGYKRNLIPSIDRKDDYKGYSFDNIQLMTWGENSKKGHTDQIKGINNKRSKAVLQFDLNGNFIKEYYSLRNASRITGINLGDMSCVCNGKLKSAGKFIWKYKKQ